jgi:hypothetical protein
MLNHVTEEKRLRALSSVREGRLYDLGRVLDESIPVFPGRFFRQTLVTTAHHQNSAMPVGENEVNWITEQVSATMQLGTHLDALSHLQIGDRGYNGVTVAEIAGTAGAERLGIETAPQIVTRGLLADVSSACSRPGDVVTVVDPVGETGVRDGQQALVGESPSVDHVEGLDVVRARRVVAVRLLIGAAVADVEDGLVRGEGKAVRLVEGVGDHG